jgi:hypothetical protein
VLLEVRMSVVRGVQSEPALSFVTIVSSVVGLLVAFFHVSGSAAGYLTAIALAAGTIVTAVMTRPPSVSVITGAAGTIFSSLVVFNIHLTSVQIGALVAATGLIVGVFIRVNADPAYRLPVRNRPARAVPVSRV